MSRTSGADTGRPEAPADELELIRRCREGERRAHEEFYRRFRGGVTANLYRVMGDRTDLDDLVQEVFVIAFRGLERFRGDARLATWLYRICINVALGRIRARMRRPSPVPLSEADVAGDTSGAAGHTLATHGAETPERLLQRQQDRERVYRILDSLPPKKRIVLYLHEIEGHDLKEIAYLVKANPVTVRTRLFYARKEFYRLLAEDSEPADRSPIVRGGAR